MADKEPEKKPTAQIIKFVDRATLRGNKRRKEAIERITKPFKNPDGRDLT